MSAIFLFNFGVVFYSNADFVPPAGGNPLPHITIISPESALVGGGGFILIVEGTGFVNGSVVNWNGSPRAAATNFISPTKLKVQYISYADIESMGRYLITVSNPAPGGGTSNSREFIVKSGATITSISPTSSSFGGPDMDIVVNGYNFLPTSKVWIEALSGTAPIETIFISENKVQVKITHEYLSTNSGERMVFVGTPYSSDVFDFEKSNKKAFTINPNLSLKPFIDKISPSSILPSCSIEDFTDDGNPQFIIGVYGANFGSNDQVEFGGDNMTTQYTDSEGMEFEVPESIIQNPATISVKVKRGGDLSSNAKAFTVENNVVPSITAMSPSSTPLNPKEGTLEITVVGDNFSNYALLVNDIDSDAITFRYEPEFPICNGWGKLVTLIRRRLLTVGEHQIYVSNPEPGGGNSNVMKFTVTEDGDAVINQMHTACTTNNKCVIINEPGSNMCTSNNDCLLPGNPPGTLATDTPKTSLMDFLQSSLASLLGASFLLKDILKKFIG